MAEEKNMQEAVEETPDTECTDEVNAEDTAEESSGEKKAKKASKKEKAEIASLRAELEACSAKLEEEKKQHLYLAAEYENYRRRSQKEKDGVYTDAVSDVIGDILPVFDNLARAALYTDGEKVAEGLALTAKSAKALLGKYGVEEFGAVGDVFDPNLHNAVMHEDNDELGENVISEVFQTGYRKGDKIIRFAMVKVAN